MVSLKTRIFRLGGLEIALEVVACPEELIGDPADEYQIPCWAEIWPSALALADYLATLDLAGQRVLELGCGLGLPGLVAAKRGATVTFNDYHPEALELVHRNALSLGLADRVSFHDGDWRSFALEGQFDLILASDVLYDPKTNPCLLAIFRDHVVPRGKILVSHPNRPDTLAALALLKEDPAWAESSWQVTVTVDDPLFPTPTVRIHQLVRLPAD